MIDTLFRLATAVSTAPATGTNDDGGGEAKKSGPIGLVVIIVLCVACYFLFKSMSKHMKKVREDFPKQLPSDPPAPPADSAPPTDVSTAAAPVDLVKPPDH